MSKRERNWRPSLMTLGDIEYDLRIGATTFTAWMAQGWMPQPWLKKGGVTRWRTSEILDAIDNFPNRDELEAERARYQAATTGGGRMTKPWADQRAK